MKGRQPPFWNGFVATGTAQAGCGRASRRNTGTGNWPDNPCGTVRTVGRVEQWFDTSATPSGGNVQFGNAQFGRINNTRLTPREVQLGVRLLF